MSCDIIKGVVTRFRENGRNVLFCFVGPVQNELDVSGNAIKPIKLSTILRPFFANLQSFFCFRNTVTELV